VAEPLDSPQRRRQFADAERRDGADAAARMVALSAGQRIEAAVALNRQAAALAAAFAPQTDRRGT